MNQFATLPIPVLLLVLLGVVVLGVLAWLLVLTLRLRRTAQALSSRYLSEAPPAPGPGTVERTLQALGQLLDRTRENHDRLERRLRELNRFLEDIPDALDDSLIVLDANLVVMHANRAARQRAQDRELVGRTCHSAFADRRLTPCDHCPALQAMWERREVRAEVLHALPDGTGGILDVRAFPLLDKDGRVAGVVQQVRDVTRAKARERELDQFRAMAEAAPGALAVLSPDHVCLAANQAFLDHAGLATQEVVGHSMSRVCGRETYDNIHKPCLERAFSGQSVDQEAWLDLAARGLRYYALAYRPVRDKEGEVARVVVACRDITGPQRDIQALQRSRDALEERVREHTEELTRANMALLGEVTERRRLQQNLETARDESERASQAKSQFLANVSHEIRTPLGGILGMAEIGRDKAPDEETRHLYRTIHSEANALLNVLNAVLDFSKLEAGKVELEAIPFNLRYLMEDMAAGFAMAAQKKGLELIVAIRPRTPLELVGDPGRLRQILVNLVGNAIKFTDRGEVAIWADLDEPAEGEQPARDRPTLRFSVLDTGLGIPKDRHQAIFESFTQADGSTSRTHGGTGLGTTIARQLAQAMGGEVGLESTPGHGSLFWFTARFKRQPAAHNPAQPGVNLPGIKALAVDDNPQSLRALSEHLTAWGIKARTATSGAQALAQLEKDQSGNEPVDVLITDLHMPGMDGFELARTVRNHPEYDDMPIVLLTEASRLGHGDECRKAGIQAYLAKPVRHQELNKALMEVLALHREPDEEPRLVTKHSLAEAGLPKATVLLVEDYATNRDVALHHLNGLGLNAEVARNGQEAVDLFGRKRFDLVLMDVSMPVMDGHQATREIRRMEARIDHLRGEVAGPVPVIGLTAHATTEARQACLDAGMDDHLVKPLTRAKLLDTLRKHLPKSAWRDMLEPRPEGQADDIQESQAPARPAPMDIPRAVAEFGGDQEFVRRLAYQFLDTVADQLERLEALVQEGRAESLAQVLAEEAHAIKGGAANLVADPLAEAAKGVEDLGRGGRLDGVEEALETLARRYARLREYLDSEWSA